MKGKCLWCGKKFEEGEGYSWPDYCTRECYYNWVGATAHVREGNPGHNPHRGGGTKATIEALQDEYARYCGYKDFEELREKDEEALRVWYLKMLEPNPHIGEAKVPLYFGTLELGWAEAHKLRYVLEQELVKLRGLIVTTEKGIETGYPGLTAAGLRARLIEHKDTKDRYEELEKKIKDFIGTLEGRQKQEQHIR